MGTMSKTLHSEEYKKVIAWLKEARETRGMTMRQLAESLGKPHSYIGKIEQAERRLDIVEYVRYCSALGVKPGDGLQKIAQK